MIEKTFPLDEHKPSISHYDTNCKLYQYSAANNGTIHLKMGLPVDVFHWKTKHKKTDIECQVHCNPYNFPELLTEDGQWAFNSSIAEQTNMWLGGFSSIVREMGVDKYNFLLDELVMRKNELTKAKLAAEGYIPSYIPGVHFQSSSDTDDTEMPMML